MCASTEHRGSSCPLSSSILLVSPLFFFPWAPVFFFFPCSLTVSVWCLHPVYYRQPRKKKKTSHHSCIVPSPPFHSCPSKHDGWLQLLWSGWPHVHCVKGKWSCPSFFKSCFSCLYSPSTSSLSVQDLQGRGWSLVLNLFPFFLASSLHKNSRFYLQCACLPFSLCQWSQAFFHYFSGVAEENQETVSKWCVRRLINLTSLCDIAAPHPAFESSLM